MTTAHVLNVPLDTSECKDSSRCNGLHFVKGLLCTIVQFACFWILACWSSLDTK